MSLTGKKAGQLSAATIAAFKNVLGINKLGVKQCQIYATNTIIPTFTFSTNWILTIPDGLRISFFDRTRTATLSIPALTLPANVIAYIYFNPVTNSLYAVSNQSLEVPSDYYLLACCNTAAMPDGIIFNSSKYSVNGEIRGSNASKIEVSSISNDFLGGATKVLSAEKGKELKSSIDILNSQTVDIQFNKTALINGYYDGTQSSKTFGSSANLKCMILSCVAGQKLTLNTQARNNGYSYIVYDVNGNQIINGGNNGNVAKTYEIIIPSGGVEIAFNCDVIYIDNFSAISYSEFSKVKNELSEVYSLKKNIAVLGSSTMMLMRSAPNYNGTLDTQNWESLKLKLGATNVYNFGLGGSSWQDKTTVTDIPQPDDNATNFVSNQIKWMKRRVDANEITKPDIIAIYATNGYVATTDADFNTAMGYTFAEMDADITKRQSFYGGIRYCLELLNRYFPDATYFIFTGVQTSAEAGRGYDYLNYGRTALQKMGGRYACPVIDMGVDCGIVDLYEHVGSTNIYLQTDGLHPSVAGKTLFTNYFAAKIKSLYFSKK